MKTFAVSLLFAPDGFPNPIYRFEHFLFIMRADTPNEALIVSNSLAERDLTEFGNQGWILRSFKVKEVA